MNIPTCDVRNRLCGALNDDNTCDVFSDGMCHHWIEPDLAKRIEGCDHRKKMNTSKCKNCAFWICINKYDKNIGECDIDKDPDKNLDGVGAHYGDLRTGSEFGCIHFKEK